MLYYYFATPCQFCGVPFVVQNEFVEITLGLDGPLKENKATLSSSFVIGKKEDSGARGDDTITVGPERNIRTYYILLATHHEWPLRVGRPRKVVYANSS